MNLFRWMLIALLLPQNLQILSRQKLMVVEGGSEQTGKKRCRVGESAKPILLPFSLKR